FPYTTLFRSGRRAAFEVKEMFNMSRIELKKRAQEVLSRADIKVGGDRQWDISVNNDQFYARVLRLGSLGLGESYMDGWWDCPALDQFFSRILNAEVDRNDSWDWRLALRHLVATAFNR